MKFFHAFSKKQLLFVGLLITCFSLLLLAGMTKHYLWGDEAETALFAQNILQFSLPRGWDGTNIMGLYNGIVLNKQLINNTTPWAQYYVVALSFALFGISTLTARLPFVVASILAALFFFILAHRLTGKYRIALIALAFLTFSVPFIMFSYQARYYALTTLATIVCIYSAYAITEQKRWGIVGFFLGGVLFFHSHYLAFGAFLLALLPSLLLLKRLSLKTVIYFAIALGGVAILTVPWYLYFNPTEHQSSASFSNFSIRNGTELFLRHLYDFNENGGLPALSIPLLIWALFDTTTTKKEQRALRFLTSVFFLSLAWLSLLSPQRLDITTRSYIRYAMNLYPLGILLQAFAINKILILRKKTGLVLLGVVLFTNGATVQFPITSWLLDYLTEVTDKSYKTSTQQVVEYLVPRIQSGETAFVSPDYNVESLQFYTKGQLRFINRISPTNLRILQSETVQLPEYIYNSPTPPDWIILFGKATQQFNAREIPKNVDLRLYSEVVLPIYSFDQSRPEIFDHAFVPKENYASDYHIYIYHK